MDREEDFKSFYIRVKKACKPETCTFQCSGIDSKQDLESNHVVNKEAEDKTMVSFFSLTTLPHSEHLKTVNGCCFVSYRGCSKTFKSPEGEGKKTN